MLLPSIPTAAVPPTAAANAAAPVPGAPEAGTQAVFTGVLEELLMSLGAPAPAPAAGKEPERLSEPLPVRLHREPPPHEPPGEKDAPGPPQPQINFMAVAPVSVPVLPPLPAPPPAPIAKQEDARSATPVPVEKACAPVTAVAAERKPALTVAVRNTDVAAEPEMTRIVYRNGPAPEKEIAPQQHHESPDQPVPEIAAAAPPAPSLKTEAPKPQPSVPVPPAEPPAVEKPQAQPVRSVALEFRPDGSQNVRVRLAEHAGEVRVSVHSADPVVTQNLRDGVTGLAATLAQAGYDARAWTPDGGQGQQQPREDRGGKREKRALHIAKNFEGALEEVSR
jgi:hypothetical protein